MTRSMLVTGSSSGIGRATAERFAEAGYKVFATMRTPSKGDDLAAEAKERNWDLEILPMDVTDQESVDAAFAVVHAQIPALDVVVNNAGMGMQAAVEEATDDEILNLYDTNILGMVRVLRRALPPMRERRDGAIVNISSMGGHVVWPYFGYYHSTKWAMEALTEALYLELQPFGIRVYAILPGLVATNFGRAAMRTEVMSAHRSAYEEDNAKWLEGFMALIPNRVGPDTVANKALEVVESGSTELRHTSDAFAEQIVTNRKQKSDAAWFAYFRELHGLD